MLNLASNECLRLDLLRYGTILTDCTVEDYSREHHRIRVIELDNTKYWVRQLNGEIIEIIELV